VRHPTRWIALGIAVLVLLFGIVLATLVGGDPRSEAQSSSLLGNAVPSFQVELLDGSKLTAADLSGRAVIVNFWNSWCPPCHAELPALKEFYARHADDPDFLMVGIVRDDTERAVRGYVKEQDIGWTIAFDPSSQAALDFGVRGQPETFAITPDGDIVGFQYSAARLRDLEALLAQARGAST
jgi:cytochrome c biogenesis protein CcmG, thiol:disulfide interchange protein DsbE